MTYGTLLNDAVCIRLFFQCYIVSQSPSSCNQLYDGGTELFRLIIFQSLSYESIQATTALAETTVIADFRGLTVFSAIYVVYCTEKEPVFNEAQLRFVSVILDSGWDLCP